MDSIYFGRDDEDNPIVTVYADDYCIRLPRYGNFTEKELAEAIENAWYSDPEGDTITLGGKVYYFQKT